MAGRFASPDGVVDASAGALMTRNPRRGTGPPRWAVRAPEGGRRSASTGWTEARRGQCGHAGSGEAGKGWRWRRARRGDGRVKRWWRGGGSGACPTCPGGDRRRLGAGGVATGAYGWRMRRRGADLHTDGDQAAVGGEIWVRTGFDRVDTGRARVADWAFRQGAAIGLLRPARPVRAKRRTSRDRTRPRLYPFPPY